MSGDAFTSAGPDFTMVVDANIAFLISESGGNGATLTGSWNVVVNGEVAAFDVNYNGIGIVGGVSVVTNITVGSSGDVFGGFAGLNLGSGSHTVVNKGAISGGSYSIGSSGLMKVTNIGTLNGGVIFSFSNANDDIFTNFQKVGKVIKNGTVIGVIALGAGDDHFNGGDKSETVHDGAGTDIYKLGGGNDVLVADNLTDLFGGTDGTDSVNGGSGVDTYDGSNASVSVTVALNLGQAFGDDIGIDNITGFENATGGKGGDFLLGNNGVNTLNGGAGLDYLDGHGGRDVLTGGAGADKFHLTKLSDSGTKVATRDAITDFTLGVDKIDLSDIDANSTHAGVDAFQFHKHLGFNGLPGLLRFQFTDGGNTVVSGDVNGDKVADFSILLQGHVMLHAGDFVL
jgi:Ca2+-binding RTX toxin-like protein